MTLSPSERRAIEQRDRERRQEREVRELAELIGIAYPAMQDATHAANAMLVKADARAIGAVTATTTRASRDSWRDEHGQLRGRVRGFAPTSDEPDTVQVTYADGTSEVRSVSSFRKTAPATRVKRAQAVAARIPETARIGIVHNLTGDI